MKKIIISITASILLGLLLTNFASAADYNYAIACVAKGTCSCEAVATSCNIDNDCVQKTCSYQQCPPPTKENSKLVGNTCTPIYNHNCYCELAGNNKICMSQHGSCSCSVQGSCQYKCNEGYVYNKDTQECIRDAYPPSSGRFCCQSEAGSSQYRCYINGCCCEMGTENEYWYYECPCPEIPTTSSTSSTSSTSTTIPGEGDHTFKFWVEGPSSFTVGEKIPVTLYVQNIEADTGDYIITYEIDSDKDYLVDVEIEDNVLEEIDKKEIKTGEAKIIIYESNVEGTIRFIATSEITGGSNWDDIILGGSEMEMSLPEFSFIGIIILISLASLIYIKL